MEIVWIIVSGVIMFFWGFGRGYCKGEIKGWNNCVDLSNLNLPLMREK